MLDIEAGAPLAPQDAAEADRLLVLAESLGVDPIDLDEAVQDAAGRYASNEVPNSGAVEDSAAADEVYDEAGRRAADGVNNEGLSGQVPYLVAQYGAEEAEGIIRRAAPAA